MSTHNLSFRGGSNEYPHSMCKIRRLILSSSGEFLPVEGQENNFQVSI